MRGALIALVLAPLTLVAAAPARPDPSACTNRIMGTTASESLDGTPGNDRILGLAGDDRLTGEAGNDCLDGGFDSDQLVGSAGSDRLIGGNGEDVLAGDQGADDLLGGTGVDHLDGGPGTDRLWGGGSGDVLRGGTANDVLRGQGGADRIYGGPGRDTLIGGQGNDDLREVPDAYSSGDPVETGQNRLDAGPGADSVNVANGHRDVVDCGTGKDKVLADKEDRLRHCEKRRFVISPFPEVRPAKGGRTRTFTIKFRSLEAIGPRSSWFAVSVKGPRGCGSLEASSIGVAYHRDRAVRYRLPPFHGKSRKAKRWCRGRYRGSLGVERASGGAAVPIGRFSFQVHG